MTSAGIAVREDDPDGAAAAEARLRLAARAAVARAPGVSAAVLYGSRARGDYRPDSDWDVAFVAADEERADISAAGRELSDALPGLTVSVLRLTARELRRKANALGNIASAVVREGKLLAGAWDRPEPQGAPRMEADEYKAFLDVAIFRMARAARTLAELPGGFGIGADISWCKSVVTDSADAAELAAKAMLGRIVGAFPRTHDLKEIGDGFAGARPELRAAVRALNGDSALDRGAGYAVHLDPTAPGRARARLAGASRLLACELREAAASGALQDAARELAQSAAAQFAAAAATVRQAETAPPPAGDPLVRAAIAQRGPVAEALEDAAAGLRALAPAPEERDA